MMLDDFSFAGLAMDASQSVNNMLVGSAPARFDSAGVDGAVHRAGVDVAVHGVDGAVHAGVYRSKQTKPRRI